MVLAQATNRTRERKQGHRTLPKCTIKQFIPFPTWLSDEDMLFQTNEGKVMQVNYWFSHCNVTKKKPESSLLLQGRDCAWTQGWLIEIFCSCSSGEHILVVNFHYSIQPEKVKGKVTKFWRFLHTRREHSSDDSLNSGMKIELRNALTCQLSARKFENLENCFFEHFLWFFYWTKIQLSIVFLSQMGEFPFQVFTLDGFLQTNEEEEAQQSEQTNSWNKLFPNCFGKQLIEIELQFCLCLCHWVFIS